MNCKGPDNYFKYIFYKLPISIVLRESIPQPFCLVILKIQAYKPVTHSVSKGKQN